MKKIQPHQLLNLATIGIPSAGASSASSRCSLLPFAQNFIPSHLVGTIAVSVTVSSVLIGQSTWNVWTIDRDFKTAAAN